MSLCLNPKTGFVAARPICNLPSLSLHKFGGLQAGVLDDQLQLHFVDKFACLSDAYQSGFNKDTSSKMNKLFIHKVVDPLVFTLN